MMDTRDLTLAWMVLGGALALSWALLRSIGAGSHGLAQALIDHRRQKERARSLEDAAAEAAGRAAALEPLALNADGSVVEPILALAENT